MVHENPNNGEEESDLENLRNPNIGEGDSIEEEEVDSACSTPYVSAHSSPSRGPSRCFFSAPASPTHFVLDENMFLEQSGSFEFEFEFEFESAARHSDGSGWIGGSSSMMSSADELFLNGQIRPMKIDRTMERLDLLRNRRGEEKEQEDCSSRSGRDLIRYCRDDQSLHRRTRSLTPYRNNPPWNQEVDKEGVMVASEEEAITTSVSSACSSRSSSTSSGRSSKRWEFLKDFLRSKSEGRANANAKERFWYAMAAKEKKSSKPSKPSKCSIERKKSGPSLSDEKKSKCSSGGGKRRLSAHEMHYTANRAQSEEMRKRTFLPYRQGLLGCLGFGSKSYGAMNGFARALNPVSSR
ncbi:hypothetical protein Scep_030778 [Stephania cephalantha]|uniref:Uncharacterized protein n=1 Tax=Stephania cephalantha TaxID=152367 RepID=A0AAP0E3Q3_9MAGN